MQELYENSQIIKYMLQVNSTSVKFAGQCNSQKDHDPVTLCTHVKALLLDPCTKAIYIPGSDLHVSSTVILSSQLVWGIVVQDWGLWLLAFFTLLGLRRRFEKTVIT